MVASRHSTRLRQSRVPSRTPTSTRCVMLRVTHSSRCRTARSTGSRRSDRRASPCKKAAKLRFVVGHFLKADVLRKILDSRRRLPHSRNRWMAPMRLRVVSSREVHSCESRSRMMLRSVEHSRWMWHGSSRGSRKKLRVGDMHRNPRRDLQTIRFANSLRLRCSKRIALA